MYEIIEELGPVWLHIVYGKPSMALSMRMMFALQNHCLEITKNYTSKTYNNKNNILIILNVVYLDVV